MNLPQPGDFIDIHIHDGNPSTGIFLLQSLMAHENRLPIDLPGIAYTIGIHPWFLTEENREGQFSSVRELASLPGILAIGESGFDRLRGPSPEIQRKAFEDQVILSEELKMPVIIHCVRAWDEILAVHKKLRPKMNWMIHGFRGHIGLANQLLSKGMYLSFWFEFVIRPEASQLLKQLPADRIFLETDGADININDIYNKVALDLNMTVEELKSTILENFNEFFGIPPAPDGYAPAH
jgi:TatD DNase family protein